VVRPYEMMVLFHPEIEDHKAAAEDIAELVKNQGGEISKIDNWGKRRLAYEIDKIREGFYSVYTFTVERTKIREMERLLKLRNSVMRHVVVRLDEK